MRVTYDGDMAYLHLTEKPAEGMGTNVVVDLKGGSLVLDIDATGKLTGIEVTGAKRLLPREVLDKAKRP